MICQSEEAFLKSIRSAKYFKEVKKRDFQAEHALYTPGLDENHGSSDFVHDIWICYKVQSTKFC